MGKFSTGYRDYYNSLEDNWTYINLDPWFEKGTFSLSVHQISRHKKVTVISLHTRVDGSFTFPFKLVATQSKIKGNVKNGKIKVADVNGCICYQVPYDMFTEGFAHRAGVDYPENWKDMTWRQLNEWRSKSDEQLQEIHNW